MSHEPWKDPIVCAEPNCDAQMESHAWALIKDATWFHQLDGKSFCPKHHPEWVAAWRAKKAENKRQWGK